MIRYIFFLLLSFFYTQNSFATVEQLPDFNKNYVGELNNKTDVVFSLKNVAGKISGFYYYDKIGVEIKLTGMLVNNIATIYELDYLGKKQAKITGKLNDNGFTGKWESLSTKKGFSLQLKPTAQKIPALPKSVIGNYQYPKDKKCKLNISIAKIKGEYVYHYVSVKRNLKGKVTFSRSLDEGLVYINFNGIEWAENKGEITPEDDTDEDLYLPTVVQGLLEDGEIVIQNDGNAMNYYVKLNDCDFEKFIRLKRQL